MNLNIDNKLLYFLSAFDPSERNRTHTSPKMIKFAGRTERFSDKEMTELEVQIKAYQELPKEDVPNFKEPDDRLDTFYVNVWEQMKKSINYEPKEFQKLCKMVLSLSHGQATVERSFRLVFNKYILFKRFLFKSKLFL